MAEHNFADFERTDLLELIFSIRKIGKAVEVPRQASSHVVLLRVHVEAALVEVIFEMMLMFWRPTRWV